MKIDLLKTIISPTSEGYVCEIKNTLHATICYIHIVLKQDLYEWHITELPKDQPYIRANEAYVLWIPTIESLDDMCLHGITTPNADVPSWLHTMPEFNYDSQGKALARCIKFISKTVHLY